MENQINDLLFDMQTGKSCIGETSLKLQDLFNTYSPNKVICDWCYRHKKKQNIYALPKYKGRKYHICVKCNLDKKVV